MKNVVAIVGSASKNSSNLNLVHYIATLTAQKFKLTILDRLSALPHFEPELSIAHTPQEVIDFSRMILNADGIIICTLEYVFSIPAGLKNAIEWCVSTTVFSDKPMGLITASAHGQKAHDELQLIMKTIEARFTPETTLLIQGVKGKFDANGQLTDAATKERLISFVSGFSKILNE